MKDLTVTYVVSSKSPDKLRLARGMTADIVRLDNQDIDVATVGDWLFIELRMLRDHFHSIQVVEADPGSFRIVFAPHADADRYWKDLVMKILTSIGQTGVSVRQVRPAPPGAKSEG